ncbi:uracil-xanthine permease family protein [Variovorax ginsengisoli]|uniref:Solute carrier family 23 protein n=1 Tax=Variovorax ginsengisoli TaxID=363844 RepID=A0ABT8S776_9BURK|nr:solute carrier family 23 protein [Variovorax ginsengisoli]MDN8615148.1 solute carrier family 23 protein [Variovorax ginsengisoli]MDO1534318.1 solute carrier family 23 protein [Variovorax ginsengisoli]
MSHKPAGLIYGVDDTPPLGINILSGLQHVGLMSIYLVYPVLIAQAAGASAEVAASLVSATLIALAVATLLQVITIGPIGSGFLCQPTSSVVYIVPSLVAARSGNLAAVFGMTMLAGLFEVALARVLPRLRPIFTPEITGLVVLLTGISVGVVGLRTALGGGPSVAEPAEVDLLLGLGTLGLMVALNVWGRGALRVFSVLIGLVAGCAAGWLLGRFDAEEVARLSDAPAFAAPLLGHVGWSFDAGLLLPFLIGAVAAVLKVIGNVTTSQKATQVGWVRADMRSISRGVLADGLGAVVAGAIGAPGINSSSSAVGLATATGVASRRVGWSVAAILLVFAFVPKLGMLFNLVPRSVLGAALVFSSTFIVTNGLVIMTSRLLDARKTLVIGLAIVFGLAVEIFPGLLVVLPPALRPSFGNSLVFGTLVGLGLNLLFRIGLRRSVSMSVAPEAIDPEALEEFLDGQGAAWGARSDVIERAKFNLVQSIETLAGSGVASGPLHIEASFDEFNLDLRVSYVGEQLELPEQRPSIEEIIESDHGERRLAGFLLRRFADRVTSRRAGERATVGFHFDH